MTTFAGHPLGVAIVFVLLGVGMGFILAPTLPELADTADRNHVDGYGLVYALYNIAYPTGMFVGPLFGGITAGWTGIQTAMIVAGGFVVLYTVPIIRSSKSRSLGSKGRI
ncbi:MFS transporter [Paenibacillus sp. GCM10027626]|uniref:MFS transporter n=1 Tax=Paenibacillus sp. GCM10027626 TaxID=3273411 RepID=UPI0036427D5D